MSNIWFVAGLVSVFVFGVGNGAMSAERWTWSLETPVGGAEVWQVMSASPSSNIVLSCDQASEMACDALGRALEAQTGTAPLRRNGPAQHAPGETTIILEMTRETDRAIEGRLRWSVGGARATTGPLLEISVMDIAVSAASYDRLAAALLETSDLPL